MSRHRWWKQDDSGYATLKRTAEGLRMSVRAQDSLEQLIEKKHAELRLASAPDPKLMAIVSDPNAPRGAIFGINRADDPPRLSGQNYADQKPASALAEMWRREVDAYMQASYRELSRMYEMPDLTKYVERDIAAQQRAHEERNRAFLRQEPEEDVRVPFYAQLHVEKPGFNMRLKIDDEHTVNHEPGQFDGNYSNTDDAYSFDLGRRGKIHIRGEAVAVCKAMAQKNPRDPREGILEGMRMLASEVRGVLAAEDKRNAPKPSPPVTAASATAIMKDVWAKPTHDVLIDRLGFERIQPTSNGARIIRMAVRQGLSPYSLPSKAAALTRDQYAYEVQFELYRETRRKREGCDKDEPMFEYREVVRPAQGKIADYDTEKLARALFESDARIIKLVRQVGDAIPMGRGGGWDETVALIAAEQIKLQPFFDKAWERGGAGFEVKVRRGVETIPIEVEVRNECERRARTVALACRQA